MLEKAMNDNILPADFNGIFEFTNWTDQDFTAKWGGVEYTFPANKRSPMLIANATPLEVQNIRKKFAKELGEREFFKSHRLKTLESQTPLGGVASSLTAASLYTEDDLKPYVEKCLNPLPIAQAKAKVVKKNNDDVFKVDEDGNKITKILTDQKRSIVPEGASIVA